MTETTRLETVEIKLHLERSLHLRKVRAGHPVVIYDRDVPIARLERIESSGSGSDQLALLRAQGLTRPPSRPLSPARLRAADSLQLAAALIAADHDPATLEILCLDPRLSSAARREGFTVLAG